jgi:shikimate dehydrogenase
MNSSYSPTGAATVVGLFGWPVKHSLSPLLHNTWLRQAGIDGVYVPFPVPPERLAEALRALPALGIRGVNVTIPHKEEVAHALEWCDPAAAAIGAVNTVVVAQDGQLRGFNTDAYGVVKALPDGIDRSRPVAVFGAGGAARAVCYGLRAAGFTDFRLANRTAARAETLAADLGLAATVYGPMDVPAMLADCALAINTTAVGLDEAAASVFDPAGLPSDAVVYDIVYAPQKTPLLRLAAARGLRTVDGLGMLIWQAEQAFAYWFDRRPAVTPATFQLLEQTLAS